MANHLGVYEHIIIEYRICIYIIHIYAIYDMTIYIYVRMFIYSTLYTYIKVVTTQNSQNMNQPLYPSWLCGVHILLLRWLLHRCIYIYIYVYIYIHIYIHIYICSILYIIYINMWITSHFLIGMRDGRYRGTKMTRPMGIVFYWTQQIPST